VFVYRRVAFGAGLGGATLLAPWMPTHVEVRTSAHAAITIVPAQAELADLHLVGHEGGAVPGAH
jgi:hypothetical protein